MISKAMTWFYQLQLRVDRRLSNRSQWIIGAVLAVVFLGGFTLYVLLNEGIVTL